MNGNKRGKGRLLLSVLFGLALLPLGPCFAATLNCNARAQVECRQEGCNPPAPIFSSLSLDYQARLLSYCRGTACYQAFFHMILAEDEELLAFNGRREQPGEPMFLSGLATIHAGRKSATLGRFEADGTVSFSRMTCE